MIDSQATQQRLEEIKRKELEAEQQAREAEAQAKADAEAAEQARKDAEAAAEKARAEQTAQAQRAAEEAERKAQEAKQRAEQEALRAQQERDNAIEQQRLAQQAEIVASTPVTCPPNQCVHDGKCYVPPANAYCTDTDPANARRCVDGYTERGNKCLSAEEIKKQQQAVPA